MYSVTDEGEPTNFVCKPTGFFCTGIEVVGSRCSHSGATHSRVCETRYSATRLKLNGFSPPLEMRRFSRFRVAGEQKTDCSSSKRAFASDATNVLFSNVVEYVSVSVYEKVGAVGQSGRGKCDVLHCLL